MKKLVFLFLLTPFLINAQDDAKLVIQNVILTPKLENVSEFERLLAEHNKKYHADETHGCRVYNIASGADIGKYVWNMGPTPWAALDSRPGDESHESHWNSVIRNCESGAKGYYWSFDTEHSFFANDFTIKHLQVMYVDVKRNRSSDIAYLLKKVQAVQSKYLADEPYGIYWNETPSTKEGRDMAVVWFFDSWAWMGNDNGFTKKFNEHYGDGSWSRWMDDWIDATEGVEIELWTLREDLSGLSGDIKIAQEN